jgi:hypothetical protein
MTGEASNLHQLAFHERTAPLPLHIRELEVYGMILIQGTQCDEITSNPAIPTGVRGPLVTSKRPTITPEESKTVQPCSDP